AMAGVPRAEERGGGAGLVDDVPDRDAPEADAVALRDRIEHRQQLLESTPAAEILDDQPILDERAVGERRPRLRRCQPALPDEAARQRPIAEKLDVVRGAERGQAMLGAMIEHRVLELIG